MANRGTSKQVWGGDRVSTISLLGCSTSVALAVGPTDEEGSISQYHQCSHIPAHKVYVICEFDLNSFLSHFMSTG